MNRFTNFGTICQSRIDDEYFLLNIVGLNVWMFDGFRVWCKTGVGNVLLTGTPFGRRQAPEDAACTCLQQHYLGHGKRGECRVSELDPDAPVSKAIVNGVLIAMVYAW